jgi:DNA-binding transcriptional ArsR family regulator
MPSPPGIEWFEQNARPEVFKALAHPIRLSIMTESSRRPVSAKEMADLLHEPLPKVSYHVRVMADAGLLTPVRRTRRRGAIETHYRAVVHLEIGPDTWQRMPVELKNALSEAILLALAQDLTAAVREGAHEKPEFLFSRAYYRADSAGRAKVAALMLEFHTRIAELEQELDTTPQDEDDLQDVTVAIAHYRGVLHGPATDSLSIGIAETA